MAITPPGRAAVDRFIGSLRIDKPKAVAASLGNPTASNRPIQDALASMLSPTPHVTLDEPEHALPGRADAATYVGFTPQLVRIRNDSAVFFGIGARSVELTIDRAALRTVLDQAGENGIATPDALQGATVAMRVPRSVRLQYGNCPAPTAATLQAQLQGPAAPTTDNGTCVALFESRPASAETAAGLPVDRLAMVAYQLAGMSPNQADAYQRVVDWRAATVLALPRGMRSYDTLAVHGAPAMLINTGGRRGPTYALVWQRDGIVFLLTGYGSPGDARALAESVQ